MAFIPSSSWSPTPARRFPAQVWLETRVPAQAASPRPAHQAAPPSMADMQQQRALALHQDLQMLLASLPAAARPALLRAFQAHISQRQPLESARPGMARLRAWLYAQAGASDALARLRAALVAELLLGVSLVQTPRDWPSAGVRPERLARRAALLGQSAAALAAHPAALPLAQELWQAMQIIRQAACR
jgi:hypothetical protein